MHAARRIAKQRKINLFFMFFIFNAPDVRIAGHQMYFSDGVRCLVIAGLFYDLCCDAQEAMDRGNTCLWTVRGLCMLCIIRLLLLDLEPGC